MAIQPNLLKKRKGEVKPKKMRAAAPVPKITEFAWLGFFRCAPEILKNDLIGVDELG